MDDATKQFMYRWVVRTVCGVVAAVVLAQLFAVFYFGDGEGLRIIDELRPMLMEAIGGMLGVLGLNRVMDSRETTSAANAPAPPLVADLGAAALSSATPAPTPPAISAAGMVTA